MFGFSFHQPIVDAVWLTSLLEMRIGCIFAWLDYLLELLFISSFDSSIETVSWPTGLQSLMLGDFFNQPLEGVVFPACLRILTFGYLFNKPVAAVK